jgi:hypothetical protein
LLVVKRVDVAVAVDRKLHARCRSQRKFAVTFAAATIPFISEHLISNLGHRGGSTKPYRAAPNGK